MGVLAPLLVCHEMVGWPVEGEGERGSPQPPDLTPSAVGRAGRWVMRAGEQALPLTGYSTQESGPTPHLGSSVELALEVWGR